MEKLIASCNLFPLLSQVKDTLFKGWFTGSKGYEQNKTKTPKKFLKTFSPERCWERKVSELRREIALSRVKVLCGEAGKEKF